MEKVSIVVMNDYTQELNSVLVFQRKGQMSTQRSDTPFTIEDVHNYAVKNGLEVDNVDIKIVTI